MLKNIKKEMLRIIECKKLKPYGSLNSETNKSTSYFRPNGEKYISTYTLAKSHSFSWQI